MREVRTFGVVIGLATALAGAVAMLVLVPGCEESTSQGATTAAPPPPVNVMVPAEREVQEFDDFTGRVAAVESLEIRSHVSGYIQSIGFKDGEFVSKGQLLFQ